MAFDVNSNLIDLKGKKYLQVMWRLVWFREEKPLWNIETRLIEHGTSEKPYAIFECKITDENGMQKSSGYGSETITDFRDYIEKAETKAVGRALAMLGYGTQFAPELDEQERVADSPVPKKQVATPKPIPKAKQATQEVKTPPQVKAVDVSPYKDNCVSKKELDYIKAQVKTNGKRGAENYIAIMKKLNIESQYDIPKDKVTEIVSAIVLPDNIESEDK